MTTSKKTIDHMAERLDNLAQQGLGHAQTAGADNAKVAATCQFSKRLVVEANEFSLANSLQTRKLGIGIHKDHRKGSATINTADGSAMTDAVDDALALAKFSVPDEHLVMAKPDDAPSAQPLSHMWHDDLWDVELDTLQETMKEVLGVLTADSRLALDRFELSVSSVWHGLWNSQGVKQNERQTMATWFFFGMGRDGEEVSGFDYDGGFSFDLESLKEKACREAKTFADKVINSLRPRKCPSYKGPVLLTPRAVREVLLPPLLYHASGRQVMDGKSKWENAVGNQVVSEKFSLKDRPHSADFTGCTVFDRDGVPTREQDMIHQGVLKTILQDCYTAKRLNAETNGMAGGPFAMDIAAGETPLQELVEEHDTLLVVDRFSGNAEPIKGDFSGVAKSSRLYEKGQDAGPVGETMIAGNVFDLMQHILGVSKETARPGGSYQSPSVLVDGMSVTGQG